MQIFVGFEAFDTIISDAVPGLRQEAGELIQRIMGSGKVTASGIFVDQRGGFLVIEVGSAEELMDLISPTMVDNFHVTTHPLVSMEKLGEFFQKWATE
ncbi:MAG TPA: hypothetical protein VE863_12585 [Pyrinomonadaceae bacterium]|jgi:hypothetical protein|nr:hypothetical protein [Pyrinomonadaceae bacterium]